MVDKSQSKDALVLSILVVVFIAAYRLLVHYQSHTSALLYIGFPFVVAIAITVFTGELDKTRWINRYRRYTKFSLIVLLASSIALFEGFLCVSMFMPVYFCVVFTVFLLEYFYRWVVGRKRSTLPLHIFPLVIVASSFEGFTPALSFDRYTQVSVTKTISADIEQIKENLKAPISLGDDMPRFLALFPMPYQVQAETLQEGDIHRSDFRYHRWFFTNTHEGHLSIKLAEIGENFIRTEVVEDTSYLANYLTLHGTLIELEALVEGGTQVTLTVSYDRKLDPAWYFAPLERFGVKQTAGYLIDKVIQRRGGSHDG